MSEGEAAATPKRWRNTEKASDQPTPADDIKDGSMNLKKEL